VRSIEPAGDEGYLILAGPVNDDDDVGFGLYLWDGDYAVREIDGPDLNTLPDALTSKPESLFDVSITESGVTASVLFDSGTVDWLEDGQESKDLPAEQQRFVSTDIEFNLPDFAPQAGDIAITAVSGSEKSFQFVALKGISEGAEITFTDSGWAGDSFRASEGAVKWTAPEGGVPAGTGVTYLLLILRTLHNSLRLTAARWVITGLIFRSAVTKYLLSSAKRATQRLSTRFKPTAMRGRTLLTPLITLPCRLALKRVSQRLPLAAHAMPPLPAMASALRMSY